MHHRALRDMGVWGFYNSFWKVSWQWIEGQVYFDFLHGLCFLYQRSRPMSYVKGRGDDSAEKPLPFASMRAAASAAVWRQMCISATGTWGRGPQIRGSSFKDFASHSSPFLVERKFPPTESLCRIVILEILTTNKKRQSRGPEQ